MGAHNGPIDGPSMGHGKMVGGPSMGHRWECDGPSMAHGWTALGSQLWYCELQTAIRAELTHTDKNTDKNSPSKK